jgi:hypothetical protein
MWYTCGMATKNPDIEAGTHYCPRCSKRTEWKGEKTQRCYECGRKFPCSKLNCSHQDCEAFRAVWGIGVTVESEANEETAVEDPTEIFEYLAS